MSYSLAIFDMDGTILDTLEDLRDSLNYSLKVWNCPPRSLAEVRNFVGNGIHKLVERGVPEGSDDTLVEQVYQTFRPYYQTHCSIKTRPYPGILELIQQLRQKGLKCAVVSNKADPAVQELCRQYFPDCFDMAVGEREGIRRKPAPDSVDTVRNTLGVSRADAVYIGDSEVDLETAENAGLDCILVEWGFRDKDYLKAQGGTVFAATTDDVLELITGESLSEES